MVSPLLSVIDYVSFTFAVCRVTIREMDKRIKKIDPTKMIEVSGFRMDSKDTKSVPFVKSEMFLTELMEEICESRPPRL